MGGQIVVGYDGSIAARRAAVWAARRAELSGDEILLVNVYQVPTFFSPMNALTPPDAAQQLAELGRSVCEAAIADLRAQRMGAVVTHQVIEGHAGPVLIGLAGRTSMLVVGATGNGLADRFVLGRVARHVLHHGRGPLVVVP